MISTLPKVSIIVPIYNIEQYLQKCVDSILKQTYKDFELLLVDDGSKDSCGTICDEYAAKDSRVRVFHKENGGLCSSRNYGLKHATGDWVCHIDGDDWVSPDYLEKLLNKAKADSADIATCDFYFAFADKNIEYTTYSWPKQGINALAEYIATTWTTIWGSLQKRSLYTENNFRSPENISYCEDFHLMTRLVSKARQVSKVDEPLYFYRQQPGSIMHNLSEKTMYDEIWAYTDTIEYFKRKGVYEKLKCPMAWRTLKATQELALDPNTFSKFKAINPDKSSFIWDCPFINSKLKFMMWCLTHRLQFVTKAITKTRKLLAR